MKDRTISLLVALLLIIAPVVQTLGQCAVMAVDVAGEMPMADSGLCQAPDAGFCDSNAPYGKVFGEKGCYSGSLCASHLYAIGINPGQSRPLANVSLFLLPAVQYAILSQIITPEIKPPIPLA